VELSSNFTSYPIAEAIKRDNYSVCDCCMSITLGYAMTPIDLFVGVLLHDLET